MASKEKATPETVQQAHARIRAEAIAYFADKPHSADDRLGRIRKGMCEFRGMEYVPPPTPAPPVAVPAEVPDPTVTMMGAPATSVLTVAPDDEAEGDEF